MSHNCFAAFFHAHFYDTNNACSMGRAYFDSPHCLKCLKQDGVRKLADFQNYADDCASFQPLHQPWKGNKNIYECWRALTVTFF